MQPSSKVGRAFSPPPPCKNILKVPGAIRRLKNSNLEEKLYSQVDVLLTPTLGLPTIELGFIRSGIDPGLMAERLNAYVPFTPLQNFTGSPAVSLPLAQTKSGVPMGIHLAAKRGQDRRILELAFALEEAMPWSQIWG